MFVVTAGYCNLLFVGLQVFSLTLSGISVLYRASGDLDYILSDSGLENTMINYIIA